jgi:dUTP pyrophosphatase
MKIATIHDDAFLPLRKHRGDAGIDLPAYLIDEKGRAREFSLAPGDIGIFRTDLLVEIPDGYFGWITNKSSKDYLIGGGIVDSTFSGELLVKIINVTDKTLHFKHGDFIAQLLILPCITPEIEIVSPLEIHKTKTERGGDGGIVRELSKSELRRINLQTGKEMDEQLELDL